MKKIAVVVVHFHLRPGGVTRVIERAVESLNDEVDIVLLSGEAPSPDAPLTPLCEPFSPLSYATENLKASDELIRDLRFTAKTLLGREPDLWHIHNHALGKNSFIPRLVKHLAHSNCRLLLQPHDFAEDGRPENYRLLRNHLKADFDQTLYPTANHIWYAPINSRDKALLEHAGLSNVHLLPNAITRIPKSSATPPTTHQVIVYPARAIRRKNIGEFLLWSLLAPEGAQFISTLAPQNPAVRPLFEQWVSFAKELQLPVQFDAGNSMPFPDLMMGATALMTTSIAEGFGLAFLEPWLEGKPLIGRNLPDITRDFSKEGLHLEMLYDQLLVPLQWADETAFHQELEASMKVSYAAYDKPWKSTYYQEALKMLIHDGRVDFGILSEPLQRKVIRHLVKTPSDRTQIQAIKMDISPQTISRNQKVVQEHYSNTAYAQRIKTLYQGLAQTTPSQPHFIPPSRILNEFLKPDRFNLLRT